MADFWGGVAQGFAPAYESALARREREAKEKKAEKREREKLEAEAEAYNVILARLRGDEAGEDPLKPLVGPAGADLLPKLEQGARSPVTRRQLLTGGITGKADIAALRAKIAERKATAAQELVRQQKLEDDRRKSEEASQIRFEQQQEARAVRKEEEERRKATDIAGRQKEMRDRLAAGAALPPRLRPDPTGTVDDPFIPKLPPKPFAPDRPVTARELAIMAAGTPEAKRAADAALRKQIIDEGLDKTERESVIPTRPTPKPTPEEEANARKMIVRVNLGLDLNATDEEVQAQLAANKAEPAKRLPYKLDIQGPKNAVGKLIGNATGISIEALAGEDMTPANWMRAMRQRSSLANSMKPPLKIDIFEPVFAPEQMGETIAIEAFKFDADPAKNEEIKGVMRGKEDGELFKVGDQYFIKKGDTLIEVKDK